MNSQPNLRDAGLLQVPIPEYGVILVFKHYVSVREIYLYRHSRGAASLGPRTAPGRRTAGARLRYRPGWNGVRVQWGQGAGARFLDLRGARWRHLPKPGRP